LAPIPLHTPAGSALALTIGQHVRHRDYKGRRVTGTVLSLGIEDQGVMATIGLDEPIVIPPSEPGDRPLDIYRQHVPAHELAPFDARDELIAEMLAALRAVVRVADRATIEFDAARAAIAKAAGDAAPCATCNGSGLYRPIYGREATACPNCSAHQTERHLEAATPCLDNDIELAQVAAQRGAAVRLEVAADALAHGGQAIDGRANRDIAAVDGDGEHAARGIHPDDGSTHVRLLHVIGTGERGRDVARWIVHGLQAEGARAFVHNEGGALDLTAAQLLGVKGADAIVVLCQQRGARHDCPAPGDLVIAVESVEQVPA